MCNPWVLLPLQVVPSDGDSARRSHVATCITTREDSCHPGRAAHLQELRALTELPVVWPSCHIGGNYYSFSNYLSYPQWLPFRCCRPVLSPEEAGLLPSLPCASFPFLLFVSPFPFLWFLNHAPFKSQLISFFFKKQTPGSLFIWLC